ncbi:gamma-mobile-trio integrase GmtZ [Rhodoferax mekongensis]|uniref:VPA1269 family protein n=1 Tax=Rhodoferax mekongensis TaxID=3068341 RepID=A0ABZ0AWS8_9BURK|nr:VPA1269 family protein [Rhodoferax sp. TBRC 17307]WNO03169.1 VPA1269 family protein [Rhodoferax sp. TBRC 17307]
MQSNPRTTAVEFDKNRRALAERCQSYVQEGLTLRQIAIKLNAEEISTKTGRQWTPGNVGALMRAPTPPIVKVSQAEVRRNARKSKKKGHTKRTDINLEWVATHHPELENWRVLAVEWLKGREAALGQAMQGINAFFDFMVETQLPTNPAELLLHKTQVPDFYETTWGPERTNGKIFVNNSTHSFIEWVLTRPEFCEEDDDERLQTSPAFRNPIPYLSRSGLAKHMESVRSTLPYGYIDELRKMIAEGPNFKDWKFAQDALGVVKTGDEDGTKRGPIWFEVSEQLIDKSDPDCVWRKRTRLVPSVPGNVGQGRLKETIYEMWSPVRWVALLVKLQLPLRTMQVRMLDSGEADTWKWQDGEWVLNANKLALGNEKRPYSNGVFLRPNRLIDGDAKVVLHINTNKTADREKAGPSKGYNVPWITGGPLHQDPFYWFEKLRRWQEKYNPLKQLTRWSDLDARHIPMKSAAQLATYPDTAFLFRTPENSERTDLPPAIQLLERPWFSCLEELQKRLGPRGETLPNGAPIRLVPDKEHRAKNSLATLFSLHSLRVSLITALALDGQVPLAILQKIAGHSRLVMTLYYTKPGAMQSREAIQAGVTRLQDSSDSTIIDWLANAEYDQLVRDAIANNEASLLAAIPEQKHLRTPAGWMAMVDGLCLVGGNNCETEAPGCHNGGPNIGNDTAPRHIPVPGGARNCPMCRWFVTKPYFLPQLAARWNNVSYHCYDAKEQVVLAEQRFRALEDRRAEALSTDQIFQEHKQYLEAQRTLEFSIRKFDELTQTLAAITRLMERCRKVLSSGEGVSLISVGGQQELSYAIEEVSSELLQLSGVCEGSVLYQDLDPGKAVLRQGQLLDAALMRDSLPPVFMTLTEEEQKLVGSSLLRLLAAQMNPENPALGRYEVISLIDARQSLRNRLGASVDEALRVAVTNSSEARAIPFKPLK